MFSLTRVFSLGLFCNAALLFLSATACNPITLNDAGTDTNADAGADAGNGGDAGGDPLPDLIAADQYCESIVDFFCPYYMRCGRIVASDDADCRATFLETCNARYEPSYIALANADLLHLSRAGVASCQEHLENVACEKQVLDLDGPCANMWIGHVPTGGACGFDVESFVCAPGSSCTLDLSFCGTCEANVDVGGVCGENAAENTTCGAGTTCDVDQGACVKRALAGESCANDEPCALGTFCDSGICRGPSYTTVGNACDRSVRCPYKSACVDGICQESGLLNERCTEEAGCASGRCASVDGDLLCIPLIPAGGACDSSFDCQTGFCIEGFCTTLPSTCIAE